MKANRVVSAVLLCLSTIVFSLDVFSQDSDLVVPDFSPDIDLYQSYLDTADQRKTSEHWLDYARFGLESVLSSWEKGLLLLSGDDYDPAELRVEAEEELNMILQERYAEWLSDNFFNSIDPPSLGNLSREIEKLNGMYLYDTDAEGNRTYRTTVDYSDVYSTDALGNETLIHKGEKTVWAEGVKSGISELLERWELKMATAFSDLKASISDEELLEELEHEYEQDYAGYEQQYRDQLYRLYNIEQSRFTRLRLYDHYSLEYESAQETASEVSSGLIAATEAELNNNLEALVSSLNAQALAVTGGTGIINADDWRESFSALLEQGMNSWDDAEQSLLMKRIEWEQDASVEVSEGEKAWAEAFHQLSEKRTEWMNEFRETLAEGNLLWAEESRELEEAIEKAVAEIDENLANSVASLQAKIDNLVGMLLQSVNMMRTARNSWEYWMDRYDEGGKDSFDSGGIEYDSDSMINSLESVKAKLGTTNAKVYDEAHYWAELFGNYRQYALEAQQSLAETYGIVVFNNASLQTAFSGNELTGALVGEDVLLDQETWEAIYLDEYQVELLKARAYLQYWQNQQEIAQAVYDYAVDDSSTKETAAETRTALAGAKAAYDDVLAEYTTSLDRLSNISVALENLQSDMETIQDEIDGYQQQLADAREQYNSTITDLEVDNKEYLASRYRDYYLQLLESMGMTADSEENPSSALEAYLLSAREYGLEEQISLVSKRVTELLSGSENTNLDESIFNSETASLSALRSRMLKTAAAGFLAGNSTEQLFGLSGSGSEINRFNNYLKDSLCLSESDYYYDLLYGYFTRYNDADTDAHERARLLWQMQLAADDIQKENTMNFELRLAEIRLLTSDDYSDWAGLYFDEESNDPEGLIEARESEPLEGIATAINEDLDVYQEIIDLYQQNLAEGGEFVIYEWGAEPADELLEITGRQAMQILWDYKSCGTDSETAAEISAAIESLTGLSAWLQSLGALEDNIAVLEAAVLNPDEEFGQQYLKAYLSGNHNLASDLGDMYSVIYSDKIEQKAFNTALAGILEENIEYAPSLSAQGNEKSRNKLIDTLKQFGLINDQEGFISPEAAWESCGFSDAEEVAVYFSELDTAAYTLLLPNYLSEVFYLYMVELKDYFAVRAASSYSNQLTSDLSSINGQIQSSANSLSRLNAVMARLQRASADSVKLLNITSADELPEELRQEAERRLIETAGFDLASEALCLNEFSGAGEAWSELFDDYISAAGTGLAREEGIEDYRGVIMERANNLWELSLALSDPDSTEWSDVSGERLGVYNAMLWNSLDFDKALERITGSGSSLNIEFPEQLKLIGPLMPEITGLAGRFSGNIYSDICAYGLGSLLVESAGYDQQQAVDCVNGFMEAEELNYTLSAEDLSDYLALSGKQRLYSLLEVNENAAIHYFKKEIAEGGFNAESLRLALDSVELPVEIESELTGLQNMLDDIKVYNELLHCDFEDFLDSRYQDDALQRQVRELYRRFMGSPETQWDDPIFMMPLGFTSNAGLILEKLAFNRTSGKNTAGLSPETSVSANDVFINEAIINCCEVLYDGEQSISSELVGLQSMRELQSRASDYLDSLDTIDADNWRSFLTDEYLASQEENALPVLENTGNDFQNQVLDAATAYMDSTKYLTEAIEAWHPAEETGLSSNLSELNTRIASGDKDFWSGLSDMSYSEIENEYSYEANAGIKSNYIERSSDFLSLISKIESLKTSLSNLGYRRARLVRMSGMNSNQQLAELQPLSDVISGLEADIEAAQVEWQELIEGPDGYRLLEQEYASVYEEADASYGLLDELKQEYSTARAIYQYASAGYLSIDEEILSEFDPVETETVTDVESGIAGGTTVASDVEVEQSTEDQAYCDALLATINRVSPVERLAYINEKMSRAQAATDALETIINNGKVTESVYSRDLVYRAYFDKYLEVFRESLVLNKINFVLNEAIAKQETVTDDALSDWNQAVGESYAIPLLLDGEGNAEVPAGLENCKISKNSGNSWGWDVNWTGPASDADTSLEYFTPDEDSVTGQSDFQNDLTLWLEKVSSLISNGRAQSVFTTWGMALKWELYDKGTDKEKGVVDTEIEDILNMNGEEDLDRDGAKALLLSEWEMAYNTVNSYAGENKWLFSFYKMMDKGGIMQADLDSEGGNFGVDFDILANRESIILANEYMAEEYHEGANALIVSSIPLFALAGVYFYAGAAALAVVPFGWIAAIAIFALAVALTLSASLLVGEGSAKHAAANQIATDVISPADTDIRDFIQGYKRDTSGILEKKQIYEAEYEKLQNMKGEAAEGEILSDEERIKLLRASTISAFAKKDEDLHGLLVQGGLIAENGSAAEDAAALELLFSEYQDMMNRSERDECVNSSLFISALEKESQDYKQLTARELNDYLTGEGGAARKQAEAEDTYRNAYYRYLAEEITLEEFEAAAEAAFGDPSFSTREHMLRLYEEQTQIAKIIMGSDQFNVDISAELLESQEVLLCGNAAQKGIYDYKVSNYRDVKVYEMQMLQLEIHEKFRNWGNQMSAITARGELEWSAGERKLKRRYLEWQKETQRLYNRQSGAWDDKYLDFLNDKQAWLDAVTIQSTKVGDMNVLVNFGEMTAASIAAAGAEVLIGEFKSKEPDPDRLLSEVVDIELLGKLLENAQSLNDSINDTENIIFTASAPDSFTTADSLQAIKNYQSLRNEEYERHLAELEYTRILEQIEFAEESFIESIDKANENIDESLNRTMRADGYKLSGSRYERQLVVGDTIGDYIYDDGYVSTYNDYDPGVVDFGRELKEAKSNVENLDSEGLQGLVERAIDNIQDRLKKIFGEDDETNAEIIADLGLSATWNADSEGYNVTRSDESAAEEPGVLKSVADWVADKTGIDEAINGVLTNIGLGSQDVISGENDLNTAEAELSPGYFGLHVGYAPGFSDTADLSRAWNDEGQVKYEGLGEMGRIMGEFIFNKMREGAGWAEVNSPHYRKRLWDDSDMFIKAPTMADVASMAVTVATMGSGAAIGGVISAAVNLSDDLVINAFDVAAGDKTLLEGAFSFGKSAAVSLVGAGFGEAAGELSQMQDVGIGEELLSRAGLEIASNSYSGAVNAIEYTEEGGLKYNWTTLEQTVAGEGAIGGYIGSAAGTASASGVKSLLAGTMTPVELAKYGDLANFGSTAARQVGEYGVRLGYQLAEDGFSDVGSSMTTAFDDMGMSLNVLDLGAVLDFAGLTAAGLSDNPGSEFFNDWGALADNMKGTGLFALNINSRGISGQITTGGVNFGSSLYNLGKGFTVDLATEIYRSSDGEGAALLDYGYAYGDQAYENTLWRVLFGKDELTFDDGDGEAETIRKSSGGRAIHMNSRYADATDEELYKAVTVLQHESYRDGITDELNAAETTRAVKAHSRIAFSLAQTYGFNFIAGDENLMKDVVAYMTAIRSGGFNEAAFNDYAAANYDSSADYWKLVENYDGSLTLHDDGRGGIFYTDEDGEEHEIGHYINGSRTEYLQKVLGLDLTKEEKRRLNNEMLVGLGAAENFVDGHFLDEKGNQVSIDLEGEWSDRMGAALDYDRMFVDAWRSEGNMDAMIDRMHMMNIAELYGGELTERQRLLAGKVDEAIDFAARFRAGTATEHLFSQTEIENEVGFGRNALCYATVPINLYQLRDPSISLDMIEDALISANNKRFIQDDGTIINYNYYLRLIGQEFDSSQYLRRGSDYYALEDYLKSDYKMADMAVYGYNNDEEHHTLYRNGHDAIDPYPYQLSWQEIENYRYRGLEWVYFK